MDECIQRVELWRRRICANGVCGTQCDISGTGIVASGTVNATDPCESCQPGTSTSAWTSTQGINASCPSGEVCDGTPASCISGCWIAGTGYVSPNTTNAGNACQICQPTGAGGTTAWTSTDGVNVGCPSGEVCNGSPVSCVSGCWIGGAFVSSGTTANGGCEVCTPSSTTTSWTNAIDGTSCGTNDTICIGGVCTGISAYTVGTNPSGIAFDGTSIWVANSGSNNVTKLLASSGAVVGTYTVGANPAAIVFDGTNIWVANGNSNNVTKLLASTGATLGTYTVGSDPHSIVFDGTNIWVLNIGSNNVTKLLASTGAAVGTYAVGSAPRASSSTAPTSGWRTVTATT